MSDRWVMVLGASFWQIPLIKKAREFGFKALAIDMNPDAEGAKYADRFEPVNITDTENAIMLGKEVGIDGVVTDQTDLAVPTLAEICMALNLPGPSPETAYNTTNKARMRELADSAGLNNPRYRVISNVENVRDVLSDDNETAPGGVGLPCVVKPTDSQASRGVKKVNTIEDLETACVDALKYSREGRVLIEEFITGTEVTVEGCRYKGETHLLGISAKKHTPPPHIIAVNLEFPAPLPDETIGKIENYYFKLVDALKIEAGSIHGELIIGDDGEIYLVEMANRGGGSGTSSHLIPAISGVDLLKANIDYATGNELPVERSMNRSSVMRFLIFDPGEAKEIHGLEKAQKMDGVVICGLYVKPGDKLTKPVMDTQRHGFLITVADTLTEAKQIADEVEKTIVVRTD